MGSFRRRVTWRLIVWETTGRSTPGRSLTKHSTTARLERKIKKREHQRRRAPQKKAYKYTGPEACTIALRNSRSERDAVIETEGRRWGEERREGVGGKKEQIWGCICYYYMSPDRYTVNSSHVRRDADETGMSSRAGRWTNLNTFLFGTRTWALAPGPSCFVATIFSDTLPHFTPLRWSRTLRLWSGSVDQVAARRTLRNGS